MIRHPSALLLPCALLLAACPPTPTTPPSGTTTASATPAQVGSTAPQAATAAPAPRYDRLERLRFNRLAVQLNLPLYWVRDANEDRVIDPAEVAALLFYPSQGRWVHEGSFTPEFGQAYEQLVVADQATLPAGLPPAELERRKVVLEELNQGRPTIVHNDLTALTADEKKMVAALFAAGALIDRLYARTAGMPPLAPQVPADDVASQSLFRRNWGPTCVFPKTEKNPICSAIPGAPRPKVDVYPAELVDPKGAFCQVLEQRPDAKTLLSPFVVVRGSGTDLRAVPYTEAYAEEMNGIAAHLREAAAAITDPNEGPLRTYLLAAAQAFTDNRWEPADEAWAKMNATNSRWYLRIAPDETYWEPCNQKAGFHMTLARINRASLAWQEKLTPLQQEMENRLATLIGKPYQPRPVTFHLPDFIDIVVNCGDDRDPMGATIGQSLPNWGPVANEGRGRTVAMTNLYTDADSKAERRNQAESLLASSVMESYSGEDQPGLLNTILHEATHNLGPSHEYKVRGQTDDQAFGGQLATLMEEAKAQIGGLWYVAFLQERGVLTPLQARQTYTDALIWSFGHISRGMYTDSGQRKPYSQLSAIYVGFLLERGAVRFDPAIKAANGQDAGAFLMDFEKLPGTIDELVRTVGRIKAQGDRAGAEKLAKHYVDGEVVPVKLIAERLQRYPKVNFVYGVQL